MEQRRIWVQSATYTFDLQDLLLTMALPEKTESKLAFMERDFVIS
jgi:hypothetical protein